MKNSWKNFSWGTRAVLAVLISKLAALKAAIEPGIGKAWMNPDQFWDCVANYGDGRHFALPLRYLESVTGLSKHAIIDAKQSLAAWGLVEWNSRKRADGGDDSDILYPNSKFFVSRSMVGDANRCHLSIERRAS